MEKETPHSLGSTADAAEIARFAAIAEEWWNPDGKFAPLHKLNPARLEFIRDHVAAHFGRDPHGDRPFAGLTVADIGCGGGLLCEPMARLGATVTGVDAAEESVRIARAHAEQMDLTIDYRFATVEALVAAPARFDVVLSMEVVEHVADLDAFLADCATLLKPGGLIFMATLNRTAKAFALGIVGAEYILGWLPRGTHDWRKFVRPSELARGLRGAGVVITELTGVAYNPLKDRWQLAPRDLDVNYMAVGRRD